jgi:hypothetical protein
MQQKLQLPLLQQAFGLLRTFSQFGYRPAMTTKDDMAAKGWKPFFYGRVNSGTPHMQANAWALSLWAGQVTGIKLFSERVYSATALLMAKWPDQWACTEYMSEELAHEVLVLAWLVRVNNTAETRGWLDAVATDLINHQRQQSGAIREWVNATCGLNFLTHNDAYGTGECGLIQSNTDPAADLLYTQVAMTHSLIAPICCH